MKIFSVFSPCAPLDTCLRCLFTLSLRFPILSLAHSSHMNTYTDLVKSIDEILLRGKLTKCHELEFSIATEGLSFHVITSAQTGRSKCVGATYCLNGDGSLQWLNGATCGLSACIHRNPEKIDTSAAGAWEISRSIKHIVYFYYYVDIDRIDGAGVSIT